ncbi:MAG: hypothetical protein JWM56_309 [Candidatus Peribacteria bacterium]|nr:hypothetical protein [Candidatus Peribacteria bacterium]
MQKISPFLWFNHEAEEAANFYTSIFKDSKLGNIARYDEASAKASGQPEGSILTVGFTLCGKEFAALNGGPVFSFTPAISLFVSCETEEEIDALWSALSKDAKRVMFAFGKQPFAEKYGWLDDKYGVSWQLMLNHKKQSISPAFLFTGNNYGKAEEAIHFWTSVFPDSKLIFAQKRGAGIPHEKEGTIEYASFVLAGEEFNAMEGNEGHQFTFTPAVSFVVNCETQQEIDTYWNALSAVPEAEQCGWLQDTFGVSWQIVPAIMEQWMTDADPEKTKRAMAAMLKMKKLDLAELTKAFEGE